MSQWGNKDWANNAPKNLLTGAANTYFSNSEVYLVDDTRLANATFGNDKAVAHQGWIKINQGTGHVAGLSVSNVNANLTYTTAYLNFSGANTVAANGRIGVTGGNNVSVGVLSPGAGYGAIPTVTTVGNDANNATLVFTVTPGGRMGRTQAETLVALSSPQVSVANSGMPYFTGV